jgi:threonine/homoserine efflux transporter RhtA
MTTGTALFLAFTMAILIAIEQVGPVDIAVFLLQHLKDVGIVLLSMAVLTMWDAKMVQRVAFYSALAGAIFLIFQHRQDLMVVMEGLTHVF